MPEERLSTGRLSIHLVTGASSHKVSMSGQIDENADLTAFGKRLDKPTEIDLGEVSFINSVGVREWIRMLRDLMERKVAVTLARCSEAMIHQINMIVEAKSDADVSSFYAPYTCDSCGFEASMCVEVAPHLAGLRQRRAPTLACPECEGAMVFNEIPERYFLFLE